MRSTAAAADLIRDGIAAICEEYALPGDFPADIGDDAAHAIAALDLRGRVDARDIPFVTLDPAGSTDLDQAFALAAEGDDLVLSYAIADVGAMVARGSRIEAEAWRRGETIYLPQRRIPQYPTSLSEGASSLLPSGDRPAVLLTVVVDRDGNPTLRSATRAIVRSRRKRAYESTNVDDLALLRDFSTRTGAADVRRGAQQMEAPEQEIVEDPSSPAGIGLRFRARAESESANAALSLAANMAVATLLINGGAGLFRDLDEPTPKEIAALHRVATAFGIDWPSGAPLSSVTATLDPAVPKDAAFAMAARRAGGGAAYRFYETVQGVLAPSTRVPAGPVDVVAGSAEAAGAAAAGGQGNRGVAGTHGNGGGGRGDGNGGGARGNGAHGNGGGGRGNGGGGAPARGPWHAAMAAPYAHATAPLRRLADRYVLDLAVEIAGGGHPGDAELATLAALPAVTTRSDAKAAGVERACLDLVESVLLANRVGETFAAVVVDVNRDGAIVNLDGPAVHARVQLPGVEPGQAVRVKLVDADPAKRHITFAPA